MKQNPYKVVEDLEAELCEYTCATYAVAVTSCTIALEMVCAYLRVEDVTIPRRTYASVPQAIVKAGGTVHFDDRVWRGAYNLKPYPIWDCAPRFTSGMYIRGAPSGTYQCLSFHRRKILGHVEGGAILCDDSRARDWFTTVRHDGRRAGSVVPEMVGYHAVMSPGTAAELLARMDHIPKFNDDMPCDDYPDLSLVDWNQLYKERMWRPKPKLVAIKWPAGSQSKEADDTVASLREVRKLRAENNDNWMDLLEHVAANEPHYFREWQAKTREKDMQVSRAMEKTCE